MNVQGLLQNGRYAQVLTHPDTRQVLESFVSSTFNDNSNAIPATEAAPNVGLAALSAFLQVNVTGPALESAGRVQQLFAQLEKSAGVSTAARKTYLASLDVDGVSIYPHTPQIELFCLARWVFLSCISDSLPARTAGSASDDTDPAENSLSWLRLRIHSWHYKLLTEPNPGPGSVFNKMTQWSDLPTLQEQILLCLEETEKQLNDTAAWSTTARVQFLVEKTNVYAMLGLDTKAKSALDEAAKLSRFEYVLSGALGKRTKFQDKSTSQLVILAKSAQDAGAGVSSDKADESVDALEKTVPQALALNNDTLLEKIDFSDASGAQDDSIPASLRGLTPNNQPQLTPLDQIILLSEATLKDAFSPADSLTLEEILPFATRVLNDKSTNWQVYSQALIVRSRIELHRSRTVERGVLQMQAMVDQVVVDTTAPEPVASTEPEAPTPTAVEAAKDSAVPILEFTGPEDPEEAKEPEVEEEKPSTFFPAGEAADQAPPQVRLRYIHALSTPPRWHLESELAFAWAGVGSLISALEIFKRLRLWAEVALCLASSSAADDEGGRGSGGEEKARGLIRWQIFNATDPSLEPKEDGDGKTLDVLSLKPADFQGAERDPPPPNVPRLLCILGDIEAEPKHYDRAWELSKGRYSRAQRSLGEHYLSKQEWTNALDAYKKAVSVNRLNPQLWGRLGDINLRLGLFSEAAEAFSRALGAANDASGGEDARTWSNLGSALYSLYLEAMKKEKAEEERRKEAGEEAKPAQATELADDEEDDGEFQPSRAADAGKKNPGTLLVQSLAAYKRGATISHDNWRIWDNVVTLASRVRPPVVSDITLAMRNILQVRNTEDAIDINVVRLLLNETVLSKPKPADGVPARGSQEKAVCDLIENMLVPLITKRSELWEVVARERVWRSDYGGAIDASEKGWRAAVGGAGSGTLGSTLSVSTKSGPSDEEKRNWLENADAWDDVVARTDELVSILENYGAEAPSVGTRWKMKARSALRSVMGKGKESWEGSAGWTTLENLLEGLK